MGLWICVQSSCKQAAPSLLVEPCSKGRICIRNTCFSAPRAANVSRLLTRAKAKDPETKVAKISRKVRKSAFIPLLWVHTSLICLKRLAQGSIVREVNIRVNARLMGCPRNPERLAVYVDGLQLTSVLGNVQPQLLCQLHHHNMAHESSSERPHTPNCTFTGTVPPMGCSSL